jgi:hypothetical protein
LGRARSSIDDCWRRWIGALLGRWGKPLRLKPRRAEVIDAPAPNLHPEDDATVTAAILLLASEERRWLNAGPYAAELLRLEGLNSVRVVAPGQATEADLDGAERIIVAAEPLRPETAQRLLAYVEAGGNLTAFLPDPEFAKLFGFEVTFRSLLGGLLRIERPGFTEEALQFHGPLRLFGAPEGAEVVAWVVDPSPLTPLPETERGGTNSGSVDSPSPLRGGGRGEGSTTTDQRSLPAILRLRRGAGTATFFLYDLPLSVLLTRQGDPMRVHLHAGGAWHGHRAADLFVDHLDLDRAHLPQADIQCHLLRELLSDANAECGMRNAELGMGAPSSIPPSAFRIPHSGPPLPFLWYFPDLAPSALLLTSDDDWSTREQFEALRDAAREHGAGITFYLVPGPPDAGHESIVTPEYKAELEAEGHTFSLHPVHQPPYDLTWRETVARQRAWYRERYGEEPGPSVRNHCVTWSGYAQAARWMQEAGFRYDTNHFSVPPGTREYQCGGGLPARVADLDGEVLAIYEAPAQFSDETTLAAGKMAFSLNLSDDEGVALIGARLRESVEGLHSMLCVNAHPISFATYSGPMWRRVFAEANRLGVPILALERFMAFWEARAGIEIPASERTETGWRWTVRVPASPSDGARPHPPTPSPNAGRGGDLQSNALPSPRIGRGAGGEGGSSTAPLQQTLLIPSPGGPFRVALDGRSCLVRAWRAFGRTYTAVSLDLEPGEHTVVVDAPPNA